MTYDLICFSHLRWNYVYQRPQHLMSRFARHRRVFFIEEPVYDTENEYATISRDDSNNVWIIVLHLNPDLPQEEILANKRRLLDSLVADMNITDYVLWYYSPMAFSFSEHLQPRLVVYDCMDELSAFRSAPPELKQYEVKLLEKTDVVFTGGNSLFEAKKQLHGNVHPFPSSIDKQHFAAARTNRQEPAGQENIPHPRLGFYGVIDERFNTKLVDELAALRPDWQFILVGPTAKINPASLPQKKNIHYPGQKEYKDLPRYLSGWDIAIMPFALNASTRYISPTKTPEYLAAGKPVISTSITDVINPYAKEGLVTIADTAEAFAAAAETILVHLLPDTEKYVNWLRQVDDFLAGNSWDRTWEDMVALMQETAERKNIINIRRTDSYV